MRPLHLLRLIILTLNNSNPRKSGCSFAGILQRGFFAMTPILSFEKYKELYPNFPIDQDEFNGLSQAAEDSIVALVENRLILGVWCADFEAALYGANSQPDFVAAMQKIIGQEIQVLYQANGLHATTGGADSGALQKIDGVPFGQYTINALIALLRKNGFMRRA